MPKEKENYYPFSGEVAPTDLSVGIFSLTEYPNKLLRKNRIGELSDGDDFSHEDIKTGLGLFTELEKVYKINTLKPDSVIGMDPISRDVVMFNVVDKIKGRNLEQADNLSVEDLSKVDEHFVKILDYFFGKFKSNQVYLYDIGSARQSMLGRKQGDSEDAVYLVDIDPRITEKHLETKANILQFWDSISELYWDSLLVVEENNKATGALINTRKKLQEILLEFVKMPEVPQVLSGHIEFINELIDNLNKQ